MCSFFNTFFIVYKISLCIHTHTCNVRDASECDTNNGLLTSFTEGDSDLWKCFIVSYQYTARGISE